MRVTVKAGGLFVRHLPEDRQGNMAEIELEDGASPAELLHGLGLAPDGRYLLTINGTALPPSQWVDSHLRDGDQLSIMPPLKGG